LIPWIIIAVIAVPVLIGAFVVTRRKTRAGEHPAGGDAPSRAELEREFAEADEYDAKWRKKDKERYRRQRLP
jgi:hypothetical protein